MARKQATTTSRNAGAAVARWALTKLSSGDVIETTALDDGGFGVAQKAADAADEEIPLVVDGPTKVLANSNISEGDFVVPDDTNDGYVETDPGTGSRRIMGRALEDASTDGDIIEILFFPESTDRA